jgi:hypothetical protein
LAPAHDRERHVVSGGVAGGELDGVRPVDVAEVGVRDTRPVVGTGGVGVTDSS